MTRADGSRHRERRERRRAEGGPLQGPGDDEAFERLVWMYAGGGLSCATTTVCGASSFLANLASVLMPLREFGLFMGLC